MRHFLGIETSPNEMSPFVNSAKKFFNLETSFFIFYMLKQIRIMRERVHLIFSDLKYPCKVPYLLFLRSRPVESIWQQVDRTLAVSLAKKAERRGAKGRSKVRGGG